jgi:hypothetical protein
VSGPSDVRRRRDVELARAILEYLSEHPDAQDTAEGIASFWVMRQEVKEEVEGVLRVLSELTDRGQLEAIRRGDQVLYRLKRV